MIGVVVLMVALVFLVLVGHVVLACVLVRLHLYVVAKQRS